MTRRPRHPRLRSGRRSPRRPRRRTFPMACRHRGALWRRSRKRDIAGPGGDRLRRRLAQGRGAGIPRWRSARSMNSARGSTGCAAPYSGSARRSAASNSRGSPARCSGWVRGALVKPVLAGPWRCAGRSHARAGGTRHGAPWPAKESLLMELTQGPDDPDV